MDSFNFLINGKKIKYSKKMKQMHIAVDESLKYIYLFEKSKFETKKKYIMKIQNIFEMKKGYDDDKICILNCILKKPEKDLCLSIRGINNEDKNKVFIIVCENKKERDLLINNLFNLFNYLYKFTKHKILFKND